MIIGVIAALVIPALLHMQHEREIQAGVKKIYGVLANGFNLTVNDAGMAKDWNWSSPAEVFSHFEKRFNLAKKCDTGSGCWVNKEIKNLKLENGANKNIDADAIYIKSRFTDGMSLAFYAYAAPISDPNVTNIYGLFYADVNGNKGPNEAGKDVVGFWITEKGVFPMSDDALTGGSTGGGGEPAAQTCDEPTPYWDSATNSCVASPVASLPDWTPCDYAGTDDGYKIPGVGCVAPASTEFESSWCPVSGGTSCSTTEITCPNGGRVPNVYELQTIYRYSNQCTNDNNWAGGINYPKVSAPCYKGTTKIPGFSSAGYWSSSEYDSSYAWGVNFDADGGYGARDGSFKTYPNRVRCVK